MASILTILLSSLLLLSGCTILESSPNAALTLRTGDCEKLTLDIDRTESNIVNFQSGDCDVILFKAKNVPQ